MFNHNGKVLDKNTELLFMKADEEGRRESLEGQNWQKHAKVHNQYGNRCAK